MATHKKLEVWSQAIDFVLKIYSITNQFPNNEQFGITSQIRRAAVSIPSNIAEGASRKGLKENIQFLYIALGSASEIDTQLIISHKLKYADCYDLMNEVNHIKARLIKYINYLKKLEA